MDYTSVMHAMIDQAEMDLLHTYNRYQIVLDHGDGAYLFDADGKKYLDFMSGIAVFAFGYNDPRYNRALKEQLDRIIHTSNYFYNEPSIRAAHRIKALSGMDRVFFTNSGAEAVEGALKAAVKHAYLKDGRRDHQIIAMEHSFHGRTYGALSVTGNAKYRLPFGQMTGDVQFASLNDLASVEALISDKTAAVILEPVQGEGGLIPASEDFLRGVRKLCDDHGIVLIFDEIQCGMGRTGDLFAWQKFGIRPDIMTCAKALGAGIPVGAFLMTEEMGQSSLTAGDHGTTYGGNPLAGSAINAVLDIFEEDDLIGHVREVTPLLEEKLQALTDRYPFIQEYRGRGLMQGLVFDRPVAPVIAKAMEKGLIFINAGPNIIRFLPPLNVTEEQIGDMYEILVSSIEEAFC